MENVAFERKRTDSTCADKEAHVSLTVSVQKNHQSPSVSV